MKAKALKLAGITLLALSLLAMPLMGACGPKVPEEEVEPIVLGFPTSLGYWFGNDALQGATLAVEEINAAGGVNVGGEMRPFKLIPIDDRDSEPGVPTADSLMAIEKLILEEQPHALIGAPNRSEVMLAAMDVFSKYKMPTINTLSSSPAIQAKILEDPEKYKYTFRTKINSIHLATSCIETFNEVREEFGFTKIFHIYQDVLWARGAVAYISQQLEALGWEVVGEEAVPLGTTDFSMALLKAIEAGAEILDVYFDMPEVCHLVDQWATMEIPAMLSGLAGPLSDPAAWELYDGKVEGVLLHVCSAGTIPVPAIPKSVEFWEAYVERFEEPAGIAAPPEAYDAVYAMKEAMERAGTLDPDAIVSELEKTNMQGAMGRIWFDESHQVPYGTDPEEGAVYLFIQWQEPGKRVVVFPPGMAEADIVLPPWMR